MIMSSPLDDRPNQKLICVDRNGNETGQIIERRSAHTAPGTKHLAIQVIVFDGKGNMILHERPSHKVGGNTLDAPTTHVLAGETPEKAALRCVANEYNLKPAEIIMLGGVSYEKDYHDGSCENEYLLAAYTVYTGPKINGSEDAPTVHYIKASKVLEDLKSSPKKYAAWFGMVVDIIRHDGNGNLLFE